MGGRRDLAQRPQLPAYDERADARRGQDREQREQGLGPDQGLERVVDVGRGQADHRAPSPPEVAANGDDAVVARSRRSSTSWTVAVGWDVGERGEVAADESLSLAGGSVA